MTTYLPEQILELLSTNPEVSLGAVKYTGPGGKGGCKELLINGETICIVIPCETRKLETTHRFKMSLFISKTIHDQIFPICSYISDFIKADIKPFVWGYNREGKSDTNYYACGKLLTSKDGHMYTKLYTEDGELIEDPQEWPTSFSGHISLRLDGIYIDNFKSRGTKVSFVVTVDEILVTNTHADTEKGSKIKKLLSVNVNNTSYTKEQSNSNDEDLW